MRQGQDAVRVTGVVVVDDDAALLDHPLGEADHDSALRALRDEDTVRSVVVPVLEDDDLLDVDRLRTVRPAPPRS